MAIAKHAKILFLSLRLGVVMQTKKGERKASALNWMH